nr:putative reverse transcriptase, RNA-dependent DNA polymerase [Tanacetum cinerariifolium]
STSEEGQNKNFSTSEDVASHITPKPFVKFVKPKDCQSENLSWAGLPEFADDTVTDYSRPSPTIESTSEEGQNKNFSTSEDVASHITPKPFVKFVKPKDCQSESKTNKKETPKKPQVKYAEQYRQSNKKPNVRGNQRNWNNLKSYQLGPDFVMKMQACFNCGDFTHLANNCRKRVKRGTTGSQNNAYMRPSHRPAGHRPHGAPMRPTHRNVGHRPHSRPMRPSMNCARPNRSFFNIQARSYETRPFHKTTAVKTQYRAPWVPTVNRNKLPVNRKFFTGRKNFPTANRKFPTASRKFPTDSIKIHTANMGRNGKAVKSSACWIWKPSHNLSNKGNISYLSNFEPFDEGYVSFGQGGCKITGKGTIKTGIKREFSNARTPQQNGVAERRNRTLIEAARTMLVVNTACYVQNRVLVNKSQNKTTYDLFNGRTPAIGFLKPFGCHVMILNTLDHLGKFEAKGDKGYFIRYSMSSKAFRVFNKRTRRVEENLHVEFLENKAIEKGIKDAVNQEVKKDVSSLRYIALPNWVHDALLESSLSKPQDGCSPKVPENSGNTNPTASTSNPPADQMETLTVETSIPTVSLPVPTACLNDSLEPSSDARLISKKVANQEETPSLDNILLLTNQFEDILGVESSPDEAIGVEANVNNMEITITVSPTPTLRIHKDHPKSQIISHVDTPIQTRHKSKEDPEFPAKVYKVEKAMYGLHQAPRAWYGTLSKYLLMNGFQKGTIDQTLFIRRKKGDFILVQDGTGKDVDSHLYRSMIGSLMYLTASRPDIMFAVFTCVMHQVTPKQCYLHAVKRIFRYLKGHPKLGLWYPKESPFDLVAYSDSDYGGATQDRKSTTGGSQFLGRRLISGQCKKQTIVATLTTQAEYLQLLAAVDKFCGFRISCLIISTTL